MANKKTCNGGMWTEARYNSFITSALRAAHTRWGPKAKAKKKAWIRRGVYKCSQCGEEGPATLPPLEGNKRRRVNACVDHITPVVDPAVGKTTWDEYIERMFIEEEGYQVLCWECHSKKSKEERKIATLRRAKEKEDENRGK